jgi:DNA repair photolyase
VRSAESHRVDERPILEPCSVPGLAYQLDPYVGCEHGCCYCYAQNDPGVTDEVAVRPGLPGRLEAELARLEPQRIYIGWATDPYQPAEAVHGQTRRALDVLERRGFGACVLTKSGLVTRDADVLARMPDSSAGVSIAFPDENVRRLFEPHAPPNEARIRALEALKAAGVTTYALVCPVMPFITDVEALVDAVAPHVDTVWFYALAMQRDTDRNWRSVRAVLDQHFPGLRELYEDIAFSPEHAYWGRLRGTLRDLAADVGPEMRIEL